MGDAHYDIYKKLDCFEWIKEKKKAGYAKHIGFSHHGSPELVDKVFTECPEMEFVQLQINYLDWESDSVKARLCYEAAKKAGRSQTCRMPSRGHSRNMIRRRPRRRGRFALRQVLRM